MEIEIFDRYRFLFRGALVSCALLVGGCATGGPQTDTYDIPADSSTANQFERWFAGGEDLEAEMPAPDAEDVEIESLFATAEMAYWAGDVERAFESYLRMIRTRPSHPLNRHASARLYELRDEVAAYRERVAPVLEEVSFSSVVPLARVYLSLSAQVVDFRRWNNSDSEAPYRADALGFPAAWRATPRLSPWRALDFDRSFAVEDHPSIRERYIAPWYAEDRPVNRERSEPYLSDGVSLSPSFGKSGIYYLETFVTVDQQDEGSSRAFWLYGNFPAAARVWVDGEAVLERESGVYGTGKRLRRLRLEEGTHRVLVKLGYLPGVGDWFDLAFLADAGRPLGGSGLTFSKSPPDAYEPDGSGVEIGDEQHRPSDLEPAFVRPDEVGRATDTALYLTLLATEASGEAEYFEPAWSELTERYPKFAPAWGLKAEQIQTLEAMPSEEKRARGLSHLRKALSYDETSIRYPLKIGRKLYRRNSDSKEARTLLERARDGAVDGSAGEDRVRNREALEAWASYLQRRGWDERAENAWRRALEADATNCRAARSLQSLWASRDHHPPLEEITPEWERCPAVERNRKFARSDRQEERLAYYRRKAGRQPYRASAQIDYADELRAQEQGEKRVEVLERARDRIPGSNAIRIELAEHRLAVEGRSAAVETLQKAIEANGSSATLHRRLAELRNEEPLADLLRDGRAAAMDHLETLSSTDETHPAAESSDEAYYLIDYAAREYAENGSSTTLTHTVVRVMTKGAIDRFGEKSIPGNARLLRARTINQDGTVQIPDRSAGKSTLSMPGLDPGDFVEFAYVQYGGSSSKARSHIEGLQFYFRMSDISSLHSEYAILGVDDASFIRQNGPPEAAPYSEAGYEGVHFVREDSPRPRKESYAPNGTEYLPWIQLYREGFEMAPFDVDRRYVTDRVRNSLESSPQLEAKLEEWREGTEPGSTEEIRELFYRVTERVTNPSSRNFSRDASHVLAAKSGSAHILLQAVYEAAGIDSELYVVKTQYEHPGEFPVGEFDKYESPLLRVELPDGESVWLNPSGPDAMFNAVTLSTTGQPAVCVSCEELVERRVPEEGFRRTERAVDIEGTLDESGSLSGTAEVTFHGIRAVSVRSTLRRTPEDRERRKFFDRVINNLMPGSNIVDFEIQRESDPDEPLGIRIEFEYPNFGRASGGRSMRVETPLFREPVASRYAKLRERERPLFIPRQRETNYTLEIDLPEGTQPELESRSGSWKLDSEWGSFRRTVEVGDGTLSVESALLLPIQRISTQQYGAFKKWAYGVQRSSRLALVLEE